MGKREPLFIDVSLKHATAGQPLIRAARLPADRTGKRKVIVAIGGVVAYLSIQQAYDLGFGLAGAVGGRFVLDDHSDG